MSASLLFGDCLTHMATLPDKSVDCFVCDLPYGCLTPGKSCSWDIPIMLEAFWAQVRRLCKDDHTPVIMFCTARFGYELIKSNESWFRYDLIWEKTNAVGFLHANKQPMRSHESIYIFSKKGAHYKRIDISGDFPPGGGGATVSHVYNASVPNLNTTREGYRCPKSVITVSNKKIKGAHPTAKPMELYRWLLERYCPAGGTVLDPTAGSFNSIRVAKELGLHGIGIEKDRGFFWKAAATFS